MLGGMFGGGGSNQGGSAGSGGNGRGGHRVRVADTAPTRRYRSGRSVAWRPVWRAGRR
jgi:hypothetical protein